MLEFNSAGLLIPPSIIKSTLDEFETYFAVDSPENTRRILFDRYVDYKNGLKKLCGDISLRQWIDGSFVTKKPKPFDIDLVNFIDFEIAGLNEIPLKEFTYPASLTNYGIDGYLIVVYPENHKAYFAYKSNCSYWINHFDKTKPKGRLKGMPKGFLEIIV